MKILIILPLMAVLSACSTIDTIKSKFSSESSEPEMVTNKVIVEDRGQSEVDAVVGEQSSFEWKESNEKEVEKMPEKEREKALTTLKSSDIKFTLYFDLDATNMNKEASQEVVKHVQFMQENPQIRLRLEGHADARGTREYNLALAENRALRVKEVLELYEGIDSRVTVVSYGEEKPDSKLDNEIGWQKNRRVEFIYE
ncbi:MAG: Peptidoglycan-associated lipoprotein [Catillopecten margaritatus gill symbiont]|uniref:Peptidoglycan-associated lipoprotein n=1 Tax=Catillopecten margaritatus gill symbiont TaxID=3083288 RepID=A0AAU6PFP6_9GAMM